MTPPTAHAWLPGWRPSSRLATWLATQLDRGQILLSVRYLVPWCLAVGVLPVLLGLCFQTARIQPLSGLLLAPILILAAWHDRSTRAAVAVLAAVGVHCALVIFLAANYAEQLAPTLDGAAEYHARTLHWIQTGTDEEYQWRYWLPAHLRLVLGVTIAGYLSLGIVPLSLGFRELDLMNFYVGRLMATSHDPLTALVYGWHPWSFVRGCADFVLLYEVVSWSLERFTGQTTSPPHRRRMRWVVGISLAIADALLKATTAPSVREVLWQNLQVV